MRRKRRWSAGTAAGEKEVAEGGEGAVVEVEESAGEGFFEPEGDVGFFKGVEGFQQAFFAEGEAEGELEEVGGEGELGEVGGVEPRCFGEGGGDLGGVGNGG
jgi:hypothetical protein